MAFRTASSSFCQTNFTFYFVFLGFLVHAIQKVFHFSPCHSTVTALAASSVSIASLVGALVGAYTVTSTNNTNTPGRCQSVPLGAQEHTTPGASEDLKHRSVPFGIWNRRQRPPPIEEVALGNDRNDREPMLARPSKGCRIVSRGMNPPIPQWANAAKEPPVL